MQKIDGRFVSGLGISGSISMFYGALGGSDGKRPLDAATGQPVEDWAVCDGSTVTAPDGRQVTTPDMRLRFGRGASDDAAVGATGGSAQVTATVQETTLTQTQMPSHSHGLFVSDRASGGVLAASYLGKLDAGYQSGFIGATGGSQPHGHGLTSDDEANLPPYVDLHYIMKL